MRKFFTLILIGPFVLFAQGDFLEIGGMELHYQLMDDSVEISLSGPTNGWVGIGFNDENNIVGSDLILFRIIKGKVEVKDMFVKGFGDPRMDTQLGGKNSVTVLSGKETSSTTSVNFRLALDSKDRNDFRHQIGKGFWLIMAYSTHDDFAHHSPDAEACSLSF